MENRQFITICSERFPDEILLETQGDLPLKEILKDIFKILNWPIEVDGRRLQYSLRTEERTLALSETLTSSGLSNFETVWISPIEGSSEAAQKKPMENDSQKDLSGIEPYWTRIPVEQPSLINPEGYMIILDRPPILIGRKGGQPPVQVDLTEFEKGRMISSRQHARITLDHGDYYLQALKTRNGTFIGRDEIQPGESRLLKNNDVIQFGLGGVRLVFRKP